MLTSADVNIVIGAITLVALYESTCPVVLVDQDQFDSLTTGLVVTTI